jgi:Amt family ammonium transporter
MSLALCLMCIVLVPFAAAGLALIQQGLGRSRSAAHAMLAATCAIGVAAIVFALLGSSLAGFAGGSAHIAQVAGRPWNWLGAAPLFARGLRTSVADRPYAALVFAFELFAVGVAALIPVSSGGDRWRLGAICASTAIFAGLMFPLFAHWAWGGGWLAEMPALFNMPGFLDAGGAGVIHVMGGIAALSTAWIVGPRAGKYSDKMAAAIPGHNIVLVLFGCMLALVGWMGLDGAASMLFYGASSVQLVLIVVNTLLAAAGGCMAAVVVTRLRYRKPDASLSANGWIAGLVACSAGSGMYSPGVTILIAAVAGALVTLSVEALELKLLIDDPGGAISVHLGAGLWGLLAFGFFGPAEGTRGGMLLAQMVGVATLLGCMFPLIHLGNSVVNLMVRFRVDADGDRQGMDIRELGSGAYPEFVVHADEFGPR